MLPTGYGDRAVSQNSCDAAIEKLMTKLQSGEEDLLTMIQRVMKIQAWLGETNSYSHDEMTKCISEQIQHKSKPSTSDTKGNFFDVLNGNGVEINTQSANRDLSAAKIEKARQRMHDVAKANPSLETMNMLYEQHRDCMFMVTK